MPLRALIYVRLSSFAGERDTSTSPERQEEACRNYAQAHGWTVVEVISDLDVSGSDKGLRLDRPGLRRVRERWADVDVLLFAKLDRIARNVADWNNLREEAEQQGVALVSIGESLDLTTPNGVFVANVLQSFAQLEAAVISSRTREAVAYMAREGRHRGGLPAFGWTAGPHPEQRGFRLVLHPERSVVLRAIVERVLAGESTWNIVDDLNRRGVESPEGKGWAPDTLRKLLRRPIVRGMQMHRRQLVRGDDGLPIRPHEPLVDDDTWHALQAELDRRSTTGGNNASVPYLLRGLVVCDLCGVRMNRQSQAGKPSVMVCGRRSRTGERCPGVAVGRVRLESLVADRFLAILGDMQVQEEESVESPRGNLREVEEALAGELQQMSTVEPGSDEDEILQEQRRALYRERQRLRALPSAPSVRIRRTGETFAEVWERSDVLERNELLASQVAEVRIKKGSRGRHGLDPNRVDIQWKAGLVEPAGAEEIVPVG